MIMLTAIPVMAKNENTVYIPKKSVYTLYPSYPGKYEIFHCKVSGKKVTVKSDNTKVVTARIVDDELLVTLKKPGIANLKVKIGKKTYNSKIVVKKYVNPLESVKIGKTTIKGKAFNKNNIASVKYSKNGGSITVKGGKGTLFIALAENKKTGQTESVVVSLD